MPSERELYESIRSHLKVCFVLKFEGNENFQQLYLNTTSDGKFPEEILSRIPQHEEIIFSFLKKKNSPDLTGFIKLVSGGYADFQFITVEIKDSTVKLDDVYQAKRYADLFRAKYGFLISTKPIPTTIKRLCNRIPILYIAGTSYEKLKLAQFDIGQKKIVEKSWFPESPFK